MEKYLKEHGITQETALAFGLTEKGRTVIIPIEDENGVEQYKKIRHLDYGKDSTITKKFTFSPVGSKASLFNTKVLKDNQDIFVTEGEIDCIRLTQEGITAVSGTAGATTFTSAWAELLKDKQVFVCYDNDEAGQKGRKRVLGLIPTAKNVYLPDKYKDICEYLLENSAKDFLSLPKQAQNNKLSKSDPVYVDDENENYRQSETPTCIHTFEEVAQKVEAYLPNSSKPLKLALAVATSGLRKNRVLLWMLLVGSPSSGKTDLLGLLKSSSNVITIDSITLNAFVSGERPTENNQVFDFLPQLDKKCFAIKDWTVIFSLDERACKKIIGDLVGIYDKTFSKPSSRRGIITYNSEFSHLGCITPATLNKHMNYLNMIGARFLFYTMPVLDDSQREKSFKAIFSNDDRDVIEKDTRLMVSDYLKQLNQTEMNIKPLKKEYQYYLEQASLFMAHARGLVIVQSVTFTDKDEEGNSKSIRYYEPLDIQIEEPWRAVQQLLTLSKYLAFVEGRDEVNDSDMELIKDIILSSMPADRAKALDVLKNTSEGEITTKELALGVDRSFSTASRLLNELYFLGLVDKNKSVGGQIAAIFTLKPIFKDLVCLDSREFMNAYSPTEEESTEPIETEVESL